MSKMLLALLLYQIAAPLQEPRAGAQAAAPFVDEEIRPFCFNLARNGKKVAIVGGSQRGGDWKVLDLATARCSANGLETNFKCGVAWTACLSDNGLLLAVGGNGARFYVLHADSGKLFCDLTREGHVGAINAVGFSADGKYIISTASDWTMRVWDLENRRPHAVFRFKSPHPGQNLWMLHRDAERAKFIFEPEGRWDVPYNFSLTPDGTKVAVAGNLDGKVPLLDLVTGKVMKTIHLKQPMALSLQFTNDGKWLVAGGSREKGMVEVWDIERNELVACFGRHEAAVRNVAISPDKKTVISGGVSDGFRVWDVATAKQKFSYFDKNDPRMPRVKVAVEDPTRRLVDAETRSAGVAFLPDGKTFLIAPHWAHWNTEIYFHDTQTGELVDFRKRVAALPKN